jgi:ketosteroid isomerase-like protein
MWAAIVEWLGAWEKVRVEAERIVDLGDKVLVLSRQSGRGKRSGVPVNIKSSDIFTVRGGRIVRWELYVDRAEGLRAAGLERSD